MSKIKLEVTKHQLNCIVNAADILSAMIGCGEEETDLEFKRSVKGVDAMLKSNGYKRMCK